MVLLPFSADDQPYHVRLDPTRNFVHYLVNKPLAPNIHKQVPFPAGRLLIDIHAAFFTAFRCFDALAVNHGGTGLLLPPSFLVHLLYQNRIDLFPQSIAFPAPIIIDTAPQGEN